jgi:hypothetical protein
MSGIDRFDPDAFIRSPGKYAGDDVGLPTAGMSVEWQRGMVRLAGMPAPIESSPARWKQIQADADAFMSRWHEQATALGWTTGNLFGFDPQQRDGNVGLVIDIRGDRVVALTRDFAALKTAQGHRWHYRLMPDDSRPIWALRGGL